MSSHWLHWKGKSWLCALAASNLRFTWWHFFISSYYLNVSNELSLTALKSKEFTLCSGSFKCKIHLVTFLYIFLWDHCFKWGLIHHKIHLVTFLYILPISWLFQMSSHWPHWKAKSSLWALPVSNVRFTWWHFFISSY